MIRTDDNAPLHPKFQQAGLSAYGWWHAALSYCGRWLTDGFIPDRSLASVFPLATPAEVGASLAALDKAGALHLLEAGQASPCGRRRATCPSQKVAAKGVLLHDYFDYQERAATARFKRRNLSAYGRQGGIKSAKMRQASAASQNQADPPLLSVPIRSVPIRSKKEGENGELAGIGFTIPEDILATLERCPILGADAELRAPHYWQNVFGLCRGLGVDHVGELYSAERYLASPRGATIKIPSRFLHNSYRRLVARGRTPDA